MNRKFANIYILDDARNRVRTRARQTTCAHREEVKWLENWKRLCHQRVRKNVCAEIVSQPVRGEHAPNGRARVLRHLSADQLCISKHPFAELMPYSMDYVAPNRARNNSHLLDVEMRVYYVESENGHFSENHV